MLKHLCKTTPFAVAVLLLPALSGCGYSAESTLDERFQSIHVTSFQNQSREYDLQAPLTNAVIRKFTSDGRLNVVTRDRADLLLEGVIFDYRLKGLTFDEDDDVTQFLSIVTAGVRVTDLQSGEILWQERALTGETTYYTRSLGGPSSDRLRGNAEAFLPTVRSFATDEENQAASEAIEQLASDIFYRTVEPW